MRCPILKLIKQFFGKQEHAQPPAPKNPNTHNKHTPKSELSTKIPSCLEPVKHKASGIGVHARLIHRNALSVVAKLQRNGYEAYLVGGCLRDILLERTPKDFDVATNASPEQIKRAFGRQCRLVGRRFRLAHIMFGRDIIEVATFRGESDNNDDMQRKCNTDGMLLRDNVYGTLEDDAKRRDFTVNSLYYDPQHNVVLDYFNGVDDIRTGKLRLIGDPKVRYQEDPVRILRAIRFMAKLDMFLERESLDPIHHYAALLRQIPAARLFDESLKLLQSGNGLKTYQLLRKFDLVKYLFPTLMPFFTPNQDSLAERMIEHALRSTDERIEDNLRINPAFMFAAVFWYPLRENMEQLKNEANLNNADAFNVAAAEILSGLCKALAVPRRHTIVIREIWFMQLQFPRRNGNQADRTFARPKFRAGFDLLAMRAELEKGELIELTEWWHEYQLSNQSQRDALVQAQNKKSPPMKKRRPRRRRTKPRNTSAIKGANNG
ncbi:polynucleotide adenylyltransferase PcnB [Spirabiliibacterium falconis]|uniref:polynucleotide adenylyltransferase PcnB n=1 Tax=Spirabiliibacterium falconis TaxID=572023 RepID=UPI001AACBE6F|nr:polynucleotide adenylyltransferase PcnB [Spirabiliibacterium falconis]MBE2894667.1 polynucleotide adenylyltransferase PcnB [Spirabiliibacterium falconis]